MSKENPNEFKIINKNERLKYRQTINELKQQLEEKDKELLKQKEKSARTEQIYNGMIVDKDKEIEKLKQQYTILENENGKLTTELIMDKYKKAQKEVSFGKQLAIQELEKLKASADKWFDSWENSKYEGNIYDKLDVSNAYLQMSCEIDQQIKELKGE